MRVRAAVASVATLVVLVVCAVSGAAQAEADTGLTPGKNVWTIPTTEKVCALTFDDAWIGTYLQNILTVLRDNGVKASFFPTGICVAADAATARQIVAEGHDLGSHSYLHYYLPALSSADMLTQVQRAEEAFSSAGIKAPVPLFRTPYGAVSTRVLSVLGGQGYANIMWTVNANDDQLGWTTSKVITRVMGELKPGAIILMHTRTSLAPQALPELIRQIKARGYRFVTLSEALMSSAQKVPRYEQSSPLLTYLGGWKTQGSPLAYGGSLCAVGTKGAEVLGSFTGTTFEILAATGPGYGELSVAIDDGTPAIVDLYSWSTLYRRRVFRVTELTDTTHTVLIRSNNTKNPASYGYSVSLDAFKVSGELLQAPQPTRYQQDDLAFSFRGPWTTVANASCSGGSIAYTDLPGSAVKVEFTGTYMAWIGKKGPGYGQARVSLDDGTPVIVDLYSSYDAYKQRIYNTGRLTDGPHTVSIQWLGSQEPGLLRIPGGSGRLRLLRHPDRCRRAGAPALALPADRPSSYLSGHLVYQLHLVVLGG